MRFAGASVFLLVLVAAPASAQSDAKERRLTVSATTGLASIEAYETSGAPLASGGGLGFAYGVRDWLEIGVAGSYSYAGGISLDDPVVDDVFGEDLTLWGNLHAAELATTARFLLVAGAPPLLARIHPLLELRGGLQMRALTGAQVFRDGTALQEVSSQRDWRPFAGLNTGCTFRAGDHLEIAVLATSSFASGHREFGAILELSWQTYRLF
ncbi:MAG: hypothetical protein V2A73_13820 [Pseudomonadota bacterium]